MFSLLLALLIYFDVVYFEMILLYVYCPLLSGLTTIGIISLACVPGTSAQMSLIEKSSLFSVTLLRRVQETRHWSPCSSDSILHEGNLFAVML